MQAASQGKHRVKSSVKKMHDRACRKNNHSGGLTAPEDVEKSGNLSDISKHLTQSKILESNVLRVK